MGAPARKGALGRKDYRAYIQSPEWRNVRKRFLASKLSKDCAGCGAKYAKGFHLHHRSYKNLGVERLMDLVVVCPSCHDRIHEDQKKDLWKHTKKVLKQIRKETSGRQYGKPKTPKTAPKKSSRMLALVDSTRAKEANSRYSFPKKALKKSI